jgi:hypothetical protein
LQKKTEMTVVTLTFNNKGDWNFLFDLLKRLNLPFEWREEKAVESPLLQGNAPSETPISDRLRGALNLSEDFDYKSFMVEEKTRDYYNG